jgi:phage/plasmid-like protein (TIGR03299 family)
MPAYHDSGFVVREPAWHGLSTVLDEPPKDWAEARRLGGIEWEPEASPLYRISAKRLSSADIALPDGRFMTTVEGSKVMVRNDTDEELGVVGKDYTPVLNQTMGEILEAFTGEDACTYLTTGAAMGGRMVYATVQLDEPFKVVGDESFTYSMAAILNGHDGQCSTKVLPLDFRVVCANTFNAAAALGDRTGLQYTFRHTGTVAERLEGVKGALANMRAEGAKYREVCEQLARVQLTSGAIDEIVDRSVNMPAPGQSSERVRDNAVTAAAQIKGILTGPTTSDAHRTSAYGLWQATGEYLDHLRAYKNTDTYVRRTLFTPEGGKGKALKLITKVAGVDLAVAA